MHELYGYFYLIMSYQIICFLIIVYLTMYYSIMPLYLTFLIMPYLVLFHCSLIIVHLLFMSLWARPHRENENKQFPKSLGDGR